MRSARTSKEYTIFLEELRGLRLRAGLSQAALAQKLRVTQDLVSKCEVGTRRVDVLELRRWAEACDSSLPAFARRLHERLHRNRRPEPLRPGTVAKKQ
jgi:transcriptional regulator with XRE-family HTH domain